MAASVANERFRRLQGEFWRLHAVERDSMEPPKRVLNVPQRCEQLAGLSAKEKQDVVGYLNLGFAREVGGASRYAGTLPLTRLGQSPAVAVQASSNWISQGYHLPRHNPSFRAFVKQRVAEGVTAAALDASHRSTPASRK